MERRIKKEGVVKYITHLTDSKLNRDARHSNFAKKSRVEKKKSYETNAANIQQIVITQDKFDLKVWPIK